MSKPFADRLTIAVLLSGRGTTFHNLIKKRDAGELDVDFRVVISSNHHVVGLEVAAAASIPTEVTERTDFASSKDFSDRIFSCCRKADVDLVVMGGFLQRIDIPTDFINRVMNIHPALIPSFCGQGMYGQRVHQAVLEYGAKVSGCTVHFVDNEYDHGPIIIQRVVPIADDDTPEILASRVFREECLAYPEALRLYASHQLHVFGRRVVIS